MKRRITWLALVVLLSASIGATMYSPPPNDGEDHNRTIYLYAPNGSVTTSLICESPECRVVLYDTASLRVDESSFTIEKHVTQEVTQHVGGSGMSQERFLTLVERDLEDASTGSFDSMSFSQRFWGSLAVVHATRIEHEALKRRVLDLESRVDRLQARLETLVEGLDVEPDPVREDCRKGILMARRSTEVLLTPLRHIVDPVNFDGYCLRFE